MEAVTIGRLAKFRGGHNWPSQNSFTVADILFTEAVRIARFLKLIYGSGP
jgi:hypothetical protein